MSFFSSSHQVEPKIFVLFYQTHNIILMQVILNYFYSPRGFVGDVLCWRALRHLEALD
jgi:hypothetical protein